MFGLSPIGGLGIVNPLGISTAPVLTGPYVEASGRLNFNGLGIKSLDDTRLPDAWGKLFRCPGASDPYVVGGMPPVRYGRWEQNLWPDGDNSSIPTTQVVAVIVGNEYTPRMGALTASGATVVFSGAFTGTLTGDGINAKTFANGTPKTAATTSLTITITGSVTDLKVKNVTGQSKQGPGEYVRRDSANSIYGLVCYTTEDDISVDASGNIAESVGATLSPEYQIEQVPGSENSFINSDTPVTQTIDLTSYGTGDFTLSVLGSGTVTSADVSATGTGHGVASEGADITFNLSVAGTVSFTISGGPPDWVQVEKGSSSTPFILTAGVAVSRAITELYHPDALTYINQGAGTVIMRVGFPLAASLLSFTEGLLSIDSATAASILYFNVGATGGLRAYDGTSVVGRNLTPWSADDVIDLFSSWETGGVIDIGGRNVTISGALEVGGTPTPFDGAWQEAGGELLFFVGMDQPAILHGYSIYVKKLPNDYIGTMP